MGSIPAIFRECWTASHKVIMCRPLATSCLQMPFTAITHLSIASIKKMLIQALGEMNEIGLEMLIDRVNQMRNKYLNMWKIEVIDVAELLMCHYMRWTHACLLGPNGVLAYVSRVLDANCLWVSKDIIGPCGMTQCQCKTQDSNLGATLQQLKWAILERIDEDYMRGAKNLGKLGYFTIVDLLKYLLSQIYELTFTTRICSNLFYYAWAMGTFLLEDEI
ncbi:hypothetical protein ACJX0J_020955 [Zea mays]